MSEQEQLPVCALCGNAPAYYGLLVGCPKPCCGARAALMSASDWRRLMARPRLAPEHVERLRSFADWLDAGFGRDDDGPDLSTDASAIRAALAALGEE